MNRDQWLSHVVKPHLGDVDIAIEVGVYKGQYSASIVKALSPNTFYGVDPYVLFEDYTNPPTDSAYAQQANLDKLYNTVQNKFKTFSSKSVLIKDTGVNAASQFEDNTLDFVYIDGDHTYEFVSGDIAAWWPKIRSGGILSGHDYIPEHHLRKIPFGVIKAVDEFAEENNLHVRLTNEQYATWWVTKP